MTQNQERRKKPRLIRVLYATSRAEDKEEVNQALPPSRYALSHVEDSKSALLVGEKQGYDLLILDGDISLHASTPDHAIAGFISAWKAISRQRHVPILLITHKEDETGIKAAYAAGAAGFLTHPVIWPMLDHHLRFLLRESRQSLDIRHALVDAEAHSRTRDNLLTIIRHEMKTPLNAISGFTRLAMDSQASGDVAALNTHLDQIVESGKSLLHTLGDMALYSDLIANRITAEKEEISAEWAVDDAMELKSRAIAASGIPIKRIITAQKTSILADIGLLSSAFARIIDNALRHAQTAKTITITLEDGSEDHLRICIEDDGTGMAATEIPACLEPFSQRDMSLARRGEGLGLGLPIVSEIAKLHGGTLTMQSNLGHGTRIIIDLPRFDGEGAISTP